MNIPYQPFPIARPNRVSVFDSFYALSGLVVLHVVLAFVIRLVPWLGVVHAWGTLLLGVLLAWRNRDGRKAVLVAAYLVGAEVFWRMCKVPIWWEFGKYGLIAIFGAYLLRTLPWKHVAFPLGYFLLLCVSIPLTISNQGFNDEARGMISFNLSGPFSLAICVLFFYQVKQDLHDLRRVAWMVTLPVVSIVSLSIYILATHNVVFITESNSLTSGGFGPNQVSAILSLGALLMFMVIIQSRNGWNRLLAAGLFLAFFAQSLLTFARGGVYNLAIGITLACFHLLRLQRRRVSALFIIIPIMMVGGLWVYFLIDNFTGGMLALRLQDFDTTNRIAIATGDLLVWQNHIVWGAGPGMAGPLGALYTGLNEPAHTEYSRVLGEHGLFGLLALVLLGLMTLRAYRNGSTSMGRAWIIALLAWSLVEMGHAAMRVAAISFVFGFACSLVDLAPRKIGKQASGKRDHLIQVIPIQEASETPPTGTPQTSE